MQELNVLVFKMTTFNKQCKDDLNPTWVELPTLKDKYIKNYGKSDTIRPLPKNLDADKSTRGLIGANNS